MSPPFSSFSVFIYITVGEKGVLPSYPQLIAKLVESYSSTDSLQYHSLA